MIGNVPTITTWTLRNACIQAFAMFSPWDTIFWVFARMVTSSRAYSSGQVSPYIFVMPEKQPTYLCVGDTEALFEKFNGLSALLCRCFRQCSRKDQLIEVVRESIATGIWSPCFQDLDNWSDWERFAALNLLVVVFRHPDDYVQDHSFLVPNFT